MSTAREVVAQAIAADYGDDAVTYGHLHQADVALAALREHWTSDEASIARFYAAIAMKSDIRAVIAALFEEDR